MISRSPDIIFLLGAGASVEAGIPASAPMITAIERLIVDDAAWKPYLGLYRHVRSAIHYAAGIHGKFDLDNYNIETLVNTLNELERNEDHPLYPFIAAWNSRFVSLADADFKNVKAFRSLILKQLKKWMCPENTAKGNYYKSLVQVQKDLNFPLTIFSLNYDLSVENLAAPDFLVETGFKDFGPDHPWDFERFEGNSAEPAPQAYLFKLHGSINWKRDADSKQLYSVKQVESVEPERMDLIFGREIKLEAADPYLFYAYAFRQAALSAKLIVVIGYGFADNHINKMLVQGLKGNSKPRLAIVSRCEPDQAAERAKMVLKQLELANEHLDQIRVIPGTAKEFLESSNLVTTLKTVIPQADAPF